MKSERNSLTPEEIENISNLTDGYSGADMKNLCQEACLGPIRSIASTEMFQISADEVKYYMLIKLKFYNSSTPKVYCFNLLFKFFFCFNL